MGPPGNFVSEPGPVPSLNMTSRWRRVGGGLTDPTRCESSVGSPIDNGRRPTASQALHGSRLVRSVVYGTLEPVELEAFLISFCALGVQVTAPVSDWIERAGRACLDQGYQTLGMALMRHADHEAGHEVLM